jgi:hypothetical protein
VTHPRPDSDSTSAEPIDPQAEAKLAAFLRQYRTPPPIAAPELEGNIMQAIAQPRRSMRSQSTRRWSRPSWWMPMALAAGLAISWLGYQFAIPGQPTTAELAQLESLLEESWDGVHEEPEDLLFP